MPFVLGPGQQEAGVPWTPYLTTERDGSLRMDAEFVMPSIWDDAPAEIVHAYTAPEAMTVALEAKLAPEEAGTAGMALSVRQNGALLAEAIERLRHQFDWQAVGVGYGGPIDTKTGTISPERCSASPWPS